MNTPLLWGFTVRNVITFLALLIIAILCHRFIEKHAKTVWLAALLPAVVWLLHLLVYWKGTPPAMAAAFPMFGIMLVWTSALLFESYVLELLNKTFSGYDILEDLLFSLALAVVFYGITVLLKQDPFGTSSLAMSPALAMVQLWLAKQYHTPK